MEEIKDPVMLLTTVFETGEEKLSGPYERVMLVNWVSHCHREASCSVMSWELKEVD